MINGKWILNGVEFKVGDTVKVVSAAEDNFVEAEYVEALPSGDFQLVDKHGVTYEVYEGVPGLFTVSWSLPIAGATTVICLSYSGICQGINKGFWKVRKTAEQLAKEARVEALMAQHEVLLSQHDILINEINELEEQIDKENS